MTSLAERNPLAAQQSSARLTLDVTIPVYNEEVDLAPCVRRLHEHLERFFPYEFLITIADNASTDGTPQVARRLANELSGVRHVRLGSEGILLDLASGQATVQLGALKTKVPADELVRVLGASSRCPSGWAALRGTHR